MIQRILLMLASDTKTRNKVGTLVGILASSILLLLIIPVVFIAVPLLVLQSGDVSHAGQHMVPVAKDQIRFVEMECEQSVEDVLEWVEITRDALVASGIAAGRISTSIPNAEELKIRPNDVIILYQARYGEERIDGRVKEVTMLYTERTVYTYSVEQESGNIIHYATIAVSSRDTQAVLRLLPITDEQKTIASVMLMFEAGHNQVQTYLGGTWHGNDQHYVTSNFTFSSGRSITYFHQRDTQWANVTYAGENIGDAGCGPTALAMVISTLIGRNVPPPEIAMWAETNGYAAYNNGSYHSLIPAASEHYGLQVESRNDPASVEKALKEGHLAIAIMGPGAFTPTGHFIVLRGYSSDGVYVADPVSTERSERIWPLAQIISEANRGAGSGGPIWIIKGR